MNLQDQVCSLEQAKRLVELGIRNESHFAFVENNGQVVEGWSIEGWEDRFYPAYTVAELGEMLPDYIVVDSYRMHPRFYKQEQNNSPALWTATYGKSVDYEVPDFDFHNEAQSRAALLTHLLESKLITVEETNKRLQQ